MTIVDGIAKGHFLRAVPGPKLSYMVLVGSRVKHVWSGCGGGPFFVARITNVGATIGRPRILHRKIHRRQANKNRASPQRRPNIIILSQPRFIVNYQSAKNRGFSLLYHLFVSYLYGFPSCKRACGVIDCCHKRGDTRRGAYTCRLGSTSSVLHISKTRRMLKN